MPKTWRTSLYLKLPRLVRFPVFRTLDEIENWWPLILTLLILSVGSALVLGLQLIEHSSARWALSALLQAGATLAGILFVALGLLWTRTSQVREKLARLQPLYVNIIDPTSEASNSIKDMLVYSIKDEAFLSTPYKKHILRECCWRFAVLRNASALYHGLYRSSGELLDEAVNLGIAIHKYTEEQIRGVSSSLSSDANLFFKYLIELDVSISLIRNDLKLRDEGLKHIDEMMYKARIIDEVAENMSKINFFRELSGNKLKAISFMWLLCLSVGLLMLVALDSIPVSLVMIPMILGIAAIGVTLSVILQSISSIE